MRYFDINIFLLTSLLIFSLSPLEARKQRSISSQDTQFLVDFLFPAKTLASFATSACRSAYQTKLDRTPEDIALEKRLPGAHVRMVEAAGQYCDREIPRLIVQRRNRVLNDWQGSVPPPILHQFANTFQQDIKHLENVDLKVRKGEMAKDAAQRVSRISSSEQASFIERQRIFIATADGAALLKRIAQYQLMLDKENKSGEWISPVMREAIQSGKKAANQYAKEVGRPTPY